MNAGSEKVENRLKNDIYLPVLFNAKGENVRIKDFFWDNVPLNLAFTFKVSIPKSNLNKK